MRLPLWWLLRPFGLFILRRCRTAIATRPTPMAIFTARSTSEGAVFGLGGSLPVVSTVTVTTIARDASQPNTNAAPFFTPRFEGSTTRNAVNGSGSSAIAKPIRTRSSTTAESPASAAGPVGDVEYQDENSDDDRQHTAGECFEATSGREAAGRARSVQGCGGANGCAVRSMPYPPAHRVPLSPVADARRKARLTGRYGHRVVCGDGGQGRHHRPAVMSRVPCLNLPWPCRGLVPSWPRSACGG